jgi:D-apionate oxidoisomerase
MKRIAIFGAAGNMGTRVVNALKGDPGYELSYVEASGTGQDRLRANGFDPTPQDVAIREADVVILAVPDTAIGPVARSVVPSMRSGAMLVCLDPAAPYGGELPDREDVSYFVTHPAHPPVFNDEDTPQARRDFFGSGLAKQAIVSALVQGSEEDYQKGEEISAKVFGPILRSHRVTLEQMALLEPVLSETVAATCLTVVREAMDEAIRRGVPAEAARDFLMGHFNIELAILFDEIDWEFSAGAKKAVEEAKKAMFKPEWKKVFDEESLQESIRQITKAG